MAISSAQKLFGREQEIDQLWRRVNSDQSSVTYVIGESGIGKSALLEELHNKLINKKKDFLVGFYGNDKVLIGESLSPIYPFITALSDLIQWIRNTEQADKAIKSLAKRFENAFLRFAKEKGSEMAGAILQDVAKKFGLEETLKLSKELLKDFKAEKSATATALFYAQQQSDEPVRSFAGVFQSLLCEFEDRIPVLVLDQFESVRKASIDFLINFINIFKYSNNTFHIIVSFTIEEEKWSDVSARELYMDARHRLYELGAVPLELPGLSEESIGEWIEYARKIQLPYNQLHWIRRNSGGFPIILTEWISNTQTFDYNEIDRTRVCHYVCMRRESLSEDDEIRLNKLAVLAQNPMANEWLVHNKFKNFLNFIKIDLDQYPRFAERLVERGLFGKNNDGIMWFKHDLVQKCLEDRLQNDFGLIYQEYHRNAAEFYRNLMS